MSSLDTGNETSSGRWSVTNLISTAASYSTGAPSEEEKETAQVVVVPTPNEEDKNTPQQQQVEKKDHTVVESFAGLFQRVIRTVIYPLSNNEKMITATVVTQRSRELAKERAKIEAARTAKEMNDEHEAEIV